MSGTTTPSSSEGPGAPTPPRPRGTVGVAVFGVLFAVLFTTLVGAVGSVAWSVLSPSGDRSPGVSETPRPSGPPPPEVTKLQPALLRARDVNALKGMVADSTSPYSDGRSLLLNGPERFRVCSAKTVKPTGLGSQAFNGWRNYYGGESQIYAASAVMGFYGDSATGVMAELRKAVQACGQREFPLPKLGNETIAFSVQIPGDQNAHDVVFVRKGALIVEVAVRTDRGSHQSDVHRLAAAVVGRLPKK